jgi:peptidyl-prolyl cis-trans isomerase B (cyclophilin B)
VMATGAAVGGAWTCSIRAIGWLLAASMATGGQGAEAPRLVFETSAGNFTILTFPLEAPQSVSHIINLVKRGFYNGQRVHRAQPGFVVQFGDPQSRDLAQRDRWGRGPGAGSGRSIGLPEISGTRKHGPGVVGLAHMGEPAKADSQLYITLDRRPELDRRYSVIGQVIDGVEVPGRLKVGDLIGRAYVAER